MISIIWKPRQECHERNINSSNGAVASKWPGDKIEFRYRIVWNVFSISVIPVNRDWAVVLHQHGESSEYWNGVLSTSKSKNEGEREWWWDVSSAYINERVSFVTVGREMHLELKLYVPDPLASTRIISKCSEHPGARRRVWHETNLERSGSHKSHAYDG